MEKEEFQELIWQKGRELFRPMPWREDTSPYHVLVSELMLQQTQVDRVVPKFQEFVAQFPTIDKLAAAPLADVLRVWSGLGYNRRAKYLHLAAKKVMDEYEGRLPATLDLLMSLPGVGPNTAGAILAYSYNQPAVFIETNVRTVYFHHWFGDRVGITDKELRAIAEQTIDREHPREWYWALMDYGTYLKKHGLGQIDRSRHYKKQSPLKGSLREVRGLILKQLAKGDISQHELALLMPNDMRYDAALTALLAEGLVAETDGRLHLSR